MTESSPEPQRRSRRDSGLDGLLLVDKEANWTSHDVVAKVRGLSGQRKVGHSGTLDPAATGLLVLCLGRATRLVQYMSAAPKTYVGVIQLGVETDTNDAKGEEIARNRVDSVSQAQLREIEQQFTGRVMQVPPAFSAVKVQGRRAYSMARAGQDVELKPREIEVHRLRLFGSKDDRLRIEVDCGSGTYIRSLARDIGRELGCGAHLASLRRLSVGGFPIAAALPIGALAALSETGRLADAILSMDEGVTEMAATIVTTEHAQQLMNGRSVAVDEQRRSHGPARVFEADGSFIGLGKITADGVLAPEKMLRRDNLRVMSNDIQLYNA